jgi:hypothetical protein
LNSRAHRDACKKKHTEKPGKKRRDVAVIEQQEKNGSEGCVTNGKDMVVTHIFQRELLLSSHVDLL